MSEPSLRDRLRPAQTAERQAHARFDPARPLADRPTVFWDPFDPVDGPFVAQELRPAFPQGRWQALPLLAQASLMIVMLLTLLRLSAAAINASFYPVHLDQAGFSPAGIGLMFACINGAISVGSLGAAAVIRRSSVTRLLFGSIALSIVAISAVPFVVSPLAVGLLSALHGLGLGLSLPTLLSAIGRQTAPGQRGLVIGLRTLFNRLGYFAVPVLLGGLVHALGLRGAFVVSGCLILVPLAGTYAYLRHRRLTYD